MSRLFRFRINLGYQEFLSFYQGATQAVIVRDEQGVTIQLPAARLRPFVTTSGIQGRFELELDELHKVRRLARLE